MLFFALSISISIHAPTRGATVTIYGVRVVEGKFQSTLPRGERRQTMKSAWQPTDFNPRSHEGSDNRTTFYYLPVSLISIHAPTRGATLI